jgi:hypothetical protein
MSSEPRGTGSPRAKLWTNIAWGVSVTDRPRLGPGRKLSDDQCRTVLDALHIITGAVLFEFAREPRDIRDTILRNLVARAYRLVAAVFTLWGIEDYQDCWILHRCLLERWFHLVSLDQTDSFETFEAWSFLEQYKAVHRVASDSSVDTSRGDLFVPPTPSQKRRASQLFKSPPEWRRPTVEDVAKGADMRFLYTYGYSHASARVHPMADDGLQDFHIVTGLEPAPTFPDQSAVLTNTLLVDTMILQDAMNASTMSWIALVYDTLSDVREYLGSGQADFSRRLVDLAGAARQGTALSGSAPAAEGA